MAYKLNDINLRTVSDPKGFMEECDALYRQRVEEAVDRILDNKEKSPIILLSGPSGSGKTTTSMKIAEALEKRGVRTHYVGMDDYFKTVDRTTPRTPEGELDLESPLCLDMELLNRHFDQLAKGERIYVPKFEFSRRMRFRPQRRGISGPRGLQAHLVPPCAAHGARLQVPRLRSAGDHEYVGQRPPW